MVVGVDVVWEWACKKKCILGGWVGSVVWECGVVVGVDVVWEWPCKKSVF